MDLFTNPIHIANVLQAKGDRLAKDQKKGKRYKTIEHNASDLIRELVRTGYNSKALNQAYKMLEEEQKTSSRLHRELRIANFSIMLLMAITICACVLEAM